MSQDLETILRKSLDNVDRTRKTSLVCSIVLILAVEAGLGWLAHLENIADVRTMLGWSVVIIVVSQSCTTILLATVMMSLARKILKAIELLSKE